MCCHLQSALQDILFPSVLTVYAMFVSMIAVILD